MIKADSQAGVLEGYWFVIHIPVYSARVLMIDSRRLLKIKIIKVNLGVLTYTDGI